MRKWIVVGLALLSGCANARNRLNGLSVGMTKEQALKVMGTPDSTSATAGVEYLKYQVRDEGVAGYWQPYYVRIVGGKVDSFGRVGEFDSATDPTLNVQRQ